MADDLGSSESKESQNDSAAPAPARDPTMACETPENVLQRTTALSESGLPESGPSESGLDEPGAQATGAACGPDTPERPDTPEEGGSLTTAEFESMTNEIARPLFATALRLTRNRDDAEDLVQEALYRGFRSLSTFRKGSRFRAWMFRILHNVFINRVRRQQLAPRATDPADLAPSDHDHPIPDLRDIRELPEVADRHFDERVKAAVDSLPDAFRVPMVLFSLGALSYQEIADALEIPIGTVMSRLHRARRHLRTELADYAREHGLAPDPHAPEGAGS